MKVPPFSFSSVTSGQLVHSSAKHSHHRGWLHLGEQSWQVRLKKATKKWANVISVISIQTPNLRENYNIYIYEAKTKQNMGILYSKPIISYYCTLFWKSFKTVHMYEIMLTGPPGNIIINIHSNVLFVTVAYFQNFKASQNKEDTNQMIFPCYSPISTALLSTFHWVVLHTKVIADPDYGTKICYSLKLGWIFQVLNMVWINGHEDEN